MIEQTIKQILQDWNDGYTHKQIVTMHNVTRHQEFAITECSIGLSVSEIAQRIRRVKSGMSAREIRAIMQEVDGD